MGNEIIKLDPECPYIYGVRCNQKSRCDEGIFTAHCIMLALRQTGMAIKENRESIIREGILQASHVLLNRGFIKKHYVEKELVSSSKIRDYVLKEIEEAKEKGLEWHEIGWEWARIPDVVHQEKHEGMTKRNESNERDK